MIIVKSKNKMNIHCIYWIFFFIQCPRPLNFIQVFSVQCHLTVWRAWEEVQVSNEKPYIITYIHTPGTDRWLSNVGSDFYISACLLLTEYNWELTIIILTLVDSCLKTAMYFFLKHVSFLETLFTMVCIPRFLYSLSTGDKAISYNVCVSQLFFIFLFEATEFFLLAIMSYDCYVAICKSLHYATIMSSRVCGRLVTCCWIAGWLVIFPPLYLDLNLKFCDYNVIDHFICDASPVLKISCSVTWFIEQMVVALAVLTDIGTFLCVVLSYIYTSSRPS